MWAEYVFAMGGSGGGGEPTGGIAGLLLPFAMVFAIIYFLMIRPQQKKQAEHRKLLEALSPGDQVLTTGGIYGRCRRSGKTRCIWKLLKTFAFASRRAT